MGRRLRWQTIIAIAGAALAIVFLAYLADTSIGELRPDFGGTYIEGVVGSPMAINPVFAQVNDVDKDLVALIFSGITRLDERGDVVPDLAQGWSVSPDGLTYTFFLRQNVQWHDGAAFSAKDVLYTIKVLQDPAFPGLPDLQKFWKRISVKTLDDFTVEFTLAEPFAPFLAYTTMGILPSHVLSGTSVAQLPSSAFNARPIGTGPFVLKDAAIDNVVLEANANYHGGRPFLSKIILRFYPDYPTALSALRLRQIQGLLVPPGEVDGETLAVFAQDKELRAYTAQRPSFAVVFLDTRLPLFANKTVRQALLYATDRQRLIDGPLGKQGTLADGPILPGTWAYESVTTTYRPDPAKAAGLMEAAGWTKNARGFWEKGGTPFQFSLMTNNAPTRIAIAEELVRQWRRFGADVVLSAGGDSGLIEDFLKPRRFQAILYGLDTGYDPDAYSIWHSSQISGAGLNFASYSNPQMDTILEKARRTPQREERLALYRQFQEFFAEDVPSILLHYPTYTYIVARSVEGIELGVLFEPSLRFAHIGDWYVKTKRIR